MDKTPQNIRIRSKFYYNNEIYYKDFSDFSKIMIYNYGLMYTAWRKNTFHFEVIDKRKTFLFIIAYGEYIE